MGIKLHLYISQSTIVENVYLRHTESDLLINRLPGNVIFPEKLDLTFG